MQGIVIVSDMEGVTASHLPMMTPATMKRHIHVFQVNSTSSSILPNPCHVIAHDQDCLPMEDGRLISLSGMHFLNMPRLVETLFSLFLSLSQEIYRTMNTVHTRGNNQAGGFVIYIFVKA